MTTGRISSRAGKPGAPVSIEYKLPAAPAVGSTIDINVTLRFDSPVDSANISTAPSAGLDIVAAEPLTLPAQKTGAEHRMTISVIPLEAGLRFVNVFAETTRGEHQRRRTFAIPVAGGGEQRLKQSGPEPADMPDGEKVISMPAEEGNQGNND